MIYVFVKETEPNWNAHFQMIIFKTGFAPLHSLELVFFFFFFFDF